MQCQKLPPAHSTALMLWAPDPTLMLCAGGSFWHCTDAVGSSPDRPFYTVRMAHEDIPVDPASLAEPPPLPALTADTLVDGQGWGDILAVLPEPEATGGSMLPAGGAPTWTRSKILEYLGVSHLEGADLDSATDETLSPLVAALVDLREDSTCLLYLIRQATPHSLFPGAPARCAGLQLAQARMSCWGSLFCPSHGWRLCDPGLPQAGITHHNEHSR